MAVNRVKQYILVPHTKCYIILEDEITLLFTTEEPYAMHCRFVSAIIFGFDRFLALNVYSILYYYILYEMLFLIAHPFNWNNCLWLIQCSSRWETIGFLPFLKGHPKRAFYLLVPSEGSQMYLIFTCWCG